MSKFGRSVDLPLINWEIGLDFSSTGNWIVSRKSTLATDPVAAPTAPTDQLRSTLETAF